MNNTKKLTSSQIRYMIWMFRLSRNGAGVKNIELATVLELSKPSIHNMLKSLAEMGIVTKQTYGLAHFTDEGRLLAKKYESCFLLLESRLSELCGDNAITENSICGILADLTCEGIDRLNKLKSV